MEFYQFHPTGIYRLGILLSEACRGDGGDHVQRQGRAVHGALRPQPQGPGQPRRLLALDLPGGPRRPGRRRQGLRLPRHPRRDDQQVQVDQPAPDRDVDSAWVESRLPDIIEFARTYLGVDPIHEPMPIQPTAHYAMGGMPTDLHGRVLRDVVGTVVPGLYAAGESACVSVHGANRLGTNSLVDLVVYGRRTGRAMAEYAARPRVRSTCRPTRRPPPRPRSTACSPAPRPSPGPRFATRCRRP